MGTGIPAAGETTSQLWTGNCLCLFSLSGGQDILHKSEKAQRADNVHDKQKSNVEFSEYFLKKEDVSLADTSSFLLVAFKEVLKMSFVVVCLLGGQELSVFLKKHCRGCATEGEVCRIRAKDTKSRQCPCEKSNVGF
ncbi:hypothetical protein [Prevotella denticola]|uniref:hypothetical protein n=1 Tax=Prevotella denticola TaxID=28129 RepID=UPI0013C36929|nr:hypothetical protein [Prevotella denticola]